MYREHSGDLAKRPKHLSLWKESRDAAPNHLCNALELMFLLRPTVPLATHPTTVTVSAAHHPCPQSSPYPSTHNPNNAPPRFPSGPPTHLSTIPSSRRHPPIIPKAAHLISLQSTLKKGKVGTQITLKSAPTCLAVPSAAATDVTGPHMGSTQNRPTGRGALNGRRLDP